MRTFTSWSMNRTRDLTHKRVAAMRAARSLKAAWSILIALAIVHVCFILSALRRATAEHLYAGLPAEDQLQLLSREVVLMHHKRLQELNNTLIHLAQLPDADRLHITIAQSLDASEASAADTTAALLQSIAPRLRLNISHRPIVRSSGGDGDGTYSVDAKRYGTKRNSFRNLLHGLDAVFMSQPRLQSAIVLEDDVILSVDALDFFDMAASLLASTANLPPPEKAVLATSFCFIRDDHEDYVWWRYLWARQLVGGASHYRQGPLRAVTIKTFSWLATREVYETMRRDVLTGPEPMLALPAGSPLHHSMAGCSWCENFCYDHYLEWRLRHASFVCPAISRARANFTGGMTERAGVLGSQSIEGHHARQRAGVVLNGQRTRSWEFVNDASRRAAAHSLFHLLRWLVPSILLLGACSMRSVPSVWRLGSTRKVKHEDDHAQQHPPPGFSLRWRLLNGRACIFRHRSHGAAYFGILCLVAGVSWLLLSRALIHLLHWQSRAPTCLPVPRHAGGHLPVNAAALHGTSNESWARLPFVLLWSTDAKSFTLRSRRCIESILYHHPQATVLVYSIQLPLDFFEAFRRVGFDVRVQRYDLAQLLAKTPAEPWLARLAEWQRGPYFYSHVTDVIRLALLFHVGGVYLDFDIIVTRPIRLGWGSDRSPPPLGGMRPLHNALGIESYEGLGGRRGPTLNGAVMAFERGSRFLWNCLDDFSTQYMADRWSWNGPELLTRVRLRCREAEGAAVQVEPRETFYPIYWKGFEALAEAHDSPFGRATWSTIESWSYTVHVWNRKTASLIFADGSLLHTLHNRWMVLPQREVCR